MKRITFLFFVLFFHLDGAGKGIPSGDVYQPYGIAAKNGKSGMGQGGSGFSYGTESNWTELREAQRQTLAVPNTGMAVSIDMEMPTISIPRISRRWVSDWLACRRHLFE